MSKKRDMINQNINSILYIKYLLNVTSEKKDLSHRIRKPTICICKNKGAGQLRGKSEADQRLCFRYTDSTIPYLLQFNISSFYLASVTVQAGLFQTCQKSKLLVFSCKGSFISLTFRTLNFSGFSSKLFVHQLI